MKKTLVTVLAVVTLVLALGVAGALGFIWYRDNHVFVEGDAYPLDIRKLDLREEDISFEYYLALRDQLPDCEILWNVPFQGSKVSNDTQKLSVTALTEKDISLMADYFPGLKAVDASGCHAYAMLETLKERLPDVKVEYAVSLGGQTYAPGIRDIVLSNGEYDYVTMMDNLQYLRELTAVKLRMPELTAEQLEALKEAYAQITFTTTVEIFGQEYDAETTEELDLSGMTGQDVPEGVSAIPSVAPHSVQVLGVWQVASFQ